MVRAVLALLCVLREEARLLERVEHLPEEVRGAAQPLAPFVERCLGGRDVARHALRAGVVAVAPLVAQPPAAHERRDVRHRGVALRAHREQHHARLRPEVALRIARVLLRRHAVVARAAALAEARHLLEELEQRRAPAAHRVHREAPQSVEALQRRRLGLRPQFLRVEVRVVATEVAVVREHQALAAQPVAPRAPDLLVVLLHGLGRAPVHDAPRVRLVDAHAERHRRHDHLHRPHEEAVVRVLAVRGRVPGVVWRHDDGRARERSRQVRRHLVHLVARGRVHDGAVAVWLGAELRHQRRQRRPEATRRRFAPHGDGEVRAVEREQRHVRVAQPELRDDVGLHARHGGGGERDQRHALEAGGAPHVADAAERGAEVVPPRRDAVRLVHRHEAEAAAGLGRVQRRERREEAAGLELLRGHIQQQQLAAQRARLRRRVRLARAEVCGHLPPGERPRAEGVEAAALVLHQRDER